MSTLLQNLKIALVHDWLLGVGGAEKTLKALHEIFPQAPIYTLFHNKRFTDEFLPEAEIRPSYLQKTYSWLGSHKLLTPLLPTAIESIDLSNFDLVISSSVAFSKGLILKSQTRHICYCYSPTRQLWDWHAEYKAESGHAPRLIASISQHLLRIWDRHASTRVDQFIAISENVRQRIKKYYSRDSTVIYPPVNQLSVVSDQLSVKSTVNPDFVSQNRESSTDKASRDCKLKTVNFFLIVSRLYKHKNIEIAVRAFNKLGWPLAIVGEGPEYKNLKSQISNLPEGVASRPYGAGKNIKMLGFISDKELSYYYQNCIAFIMPQEEDFGITPIEAMGYGKPVLALARGGALEYIQEGINGEFFEDPTEEVLADGVRRLAENLPKYSPAEIKKSAEKFTTDRFKKEIANLILEKTTSFSPVPTERSDYHNY